MRRRSPEGPGRARGVGQNYWGCPTRLPLEHRTAHPHHIHLGGSGRVRKREEGLDRVRCVRVGLGYVCIYISVGIHISGGEY